VNEELRASGVFQNEDEETLSWLPIKFQLLDEDMPVQIKIVADFQEVIEEDNIVLFDSTYDHILNLQTLAITETGILTQDSRLGYESPLVEIPVDLGTRHGDWSFGLSEFGNVITAVKTVKLSGKGYNCKLHLVDTSKSKWTLESLGFTYRMRRARSR
jgi:hypothetical protein